ncbi:acetate/propionate family kinase (plasmid) [Phyllobacterium sp. 628]|nr:acetate/propionate family kinase [Phyllobacterium sp. 628]
MHVLTLNSGSSSLKFGYYRASASRTKVLVSGEADFSDSDQGKFYAHGSRKYDLTTEPTPIRNQKDAFGLIIKFLRDAKMSMPDAIGHRIVHGGPKLRKHCLINKAVLEQIKGAHAFAPLHLPDELSVIQLAREHFPQVPHVACFDTVFHTTIPDVARTLPLPIEYRSEGIERYGFHGLSCDSIVHQLRGNLPKRLIVAHLGNGASVTAIRNGRSIDNSMGMTPAGGLIMGTRCGDLDPGVLVYVAREKGLDANGLEDLINHQSGLLGISGLSSDMRRLHEASPSNSNARLAIDMFVYTLRKQLAAMAATLGGVDMIVFTGGIGENDAEIRAATCMGLSAFGLIIDHHRNVAVKSPISAPTSCCDVRVLTSDEDERIAHHTRAIVSANNCQNEQHHRTRVAATGEAKK